MGRNLLFITSQGGVSENGLSYILDLAKATRKGITVLMVYKRKFSERFENLMTAITFAEAGEHETARRLMETAASKETEEEKLQDFKERCKDSGIAANIYMASEDIHSALRNLLKKDKSIDMVLLSPDITGNSMTTRDLEKLLKTVSVPIITLTSKAKAESDKLVEAA